MCSQLHRESKSNNEPSRNKCVLCVDEGWGGMCSQLHRESRSNNESSRNKCVFCVDGWGGLGWSVQPLHRESGSSNEPCKLSPLNFNHSNLLYTGKAFCREEKGDI